METKTRKEYECVYTANGILAAEMIKNFLAAHDIEAIIRQESVGTTLGLTVGELGEASIYVRKTDVDTAIGLLKDMEEDRFIDDFSEDN